MGYETAKIITEEGLEGIGRYYSTYRGIVIENIDPENMNRIKVCVPDIMGGVFSWAYSKGQHGSIDSGFKFLAPKIADIVYITFEFGDITKPLWEYHGWSQGQIPEPLSGPNRLGLITPEGNLIVIDDDEGKLNLYFNGPVHVNSQKEIVLQSSSDILLNSDDTIILNTGENGGLINIDQLTEKLNNTIKELEVLRNTFNQHVHMGVTVGKDPTPPTLTQVNKQFSKYNSEDYEDTTSIH